MTAHQTSHRDPRRPAVPGPVRASALTATCLIAAAALVAFVLWDRPAVLPDPTITWWMLAPAFLVTELAVVRIGVRRHTHTFTLGGIPLVAGLLFAEPTHLILGEIAGVAAALLLVGRRRGPRPGFNAARSVLTTCVVAALVQLGVEASGTAPGVPWLWLVALGAVLGGAGLAGLLAVIATAASGGGWPGARELRGAAGIGTAAVLGTASLGLACAELLRHDPLALTLLLMPAGALIGVHRAHAREARRGERAELLYRSMRRVRAAADIRAAVAELLDEARWLFRADVARIVLMPSGDDEAALRSTRGPGEEMELMVRLEPSAARGELTAADDDDPHTLRARLETGDRLLGVVSVTRSGDAETFDGTDGSLLGTYAGHVAAALERGRLQRSLADLATAGEHLARTTLTDALTGLANRTLLEERLAHALTRRGRHLVGVVLLDLHRLREVNDDHGREAGDRVLVAVAGRLRASLRADDTAARLDGGRFAIVLDGLADRSEAAAISTRLAATLREPIDVGSRTLRVSAGVGLAVGTAGQATTNLLLADADTDLYRRARRARVPGPMGPGTGSGR